MHRFILIASLVGVLTSFGQGAIAQVDSETDAADDFQISKSVGIGLAGFTTQTNFSMTDSHGVSYNAMSLLGSKQTRETIELSEDDYADMQATQAEMVEELESMTLSAIYSDEHRDRLKSRFMKVEREFREKLDDHQLTQLGFARARIGIDQVGLSYLAEPDVAKEIGLSEKVADAIREQSKDFINEMNSQNLELLKKANHKLIESLTQSQQSEMKSLLSEQSRSRFLMTGLFLEGRVDRRKSVQLGFKLNSMLRRSSIQRELKLSVEQTEQFKKIDKRDPELESLIAANLTESQLADLFQFAFAERLDNCGTVNLMSTGILGQKLGLSDEEVDEMFAVGKELQDRLVQQQEELSKGLVVAKFGVSKDQAVKIAKLFVRNY